MREAKPAAPTAPELPVYRPQPGPQTELETTTADEILFGGAAFGGKALSINTPIPTPGGWTTMGDLEPGDEIFGDDGLPCRVLGVSPVRCGRLCFEVVFSDGATIVADGEHLWPTLTYDERLKLRKHDPEWRVARRAKRPSRGTGAKPWLAERNATRAYSVSPPPVPVARTTEEIAKTLKIGRRANHSIHVTPPLWLPHAELPIDPYLLGLWLGDGSSSGGSFTTADLVLLDAWRAAGYRVTKHKAKYIFGILGLYRHLRRNGLMNNKHVPPEYLRASFDQRLALVQGLMDSDGHADIDGGCEFVTTSPSVRDGFAELVHSLGIKGSMREGRSTINGRYVGPKWRMQFLTELPMFRLSRKLQRQKRDGFRGNHRRRYVVDVRPVPSVPVKCISVDCESRCFLAGRDMVPTHNTIGVIGALRSRVKMRGYRAIVFRRTTKDLKNALDRAKEIYRDGRAVGPSGFAAFAPGGLSRFRQSGEGGTMLFPAWGARIEFGHLHKDDDYRAHLGQEYDDIVFDEGPEFTRQQYENLSTRRRGIISGIRRRTIVTANPPEEDQPGHEWIRQKWGPWIDPKAKVEDFDGLDDGGLDGTGVYRPPRPVRLVGLPDRFDERGERLPPAHSARVLYVAKDATGRERFSAEPFVWSGARAEGRTFIAATLRDNPAGLKAEPDYPAKLRQVNPVRRRQLEEGDWTVRRGRGSMFRREWFEIVEPERRPKESDVVGRVRVWDKAATEPSTKNPDPDWTRGLKGCRLRDGTILVEDLVGCRLAPGGRDALILSTAKGDGPEVRIRGPEDPAAAGVADATAFVKMLVGFTVRTAKVSGNKVLRAGPASSMAEPLPGAKHGRIKVLRAPWNDEFFGELEAFPEGGHDDIVDVLSDLFDELVNRTRAAAGTPPPLVTSNPEAQTLGV